MGTLMMWLGFGASTRDWLIALCCGAAMWCVYSRRIAAEEKMLIDRFGESYVDYMRSTPGLVPFRLGGR